MQGEVFGYHQMHYSNAKFAIGLALLGQVDKRNYSIGRFSPPIFSTAISDSLFRFAISNIHFHRGSPCFMSDHFVEYRRGKSGLNSNKTDNNNRNNIARQAQAK